jgi:16S rRNA (cytidine1402-2'-O)-methyltransferase
MSQPGKLYLLPVPVTEEGGYQHIPAYNTAIVKTLTRFIAEDAKTARRCLKGFGYTRLPEAEIFLLNEHTKKGELGNLLMPLLNGEDVGLMSDAGCPGIADPGAEVVRMAHARGIEVVPLVGPSAIVLSIMASGFNGQNFAFTGYLPIDKPAKIKRLRELEQLAGKNGQAQFFIETPYRNEQMLEAMLEALSAQTLLFIGRDITSAKQLLISKSVGEWKKGPRPPMHKVPVVFGIYSV